MIFDSDCMIEQCVARESTRWATNHVYLDVTDDPRVGHLVATEGRILCAIPVELDDADTPGLVSRQAIRLAREQSRGGKVRIMCGKRLELDDRTTLVRPEGKFPPWRDVIPDGVAAVVLTLDAELLGKIAKGAKARKVQLSVIAPHTTLRVTPCYDMGGRGLACALMAVRADGDTEDFSGVSVEWADEPKRK
jgi:hypothetical protein